MSTHEFDYIVVGAGSAGCCLANRLSRDPGRRVLLLEAGGRDTSPLIKMGLGFTRLMYDRSVSNLYTTEPEPHLDGRRLSVVRGRVLGGCSSINGQVYMRGQAQDYDDWAAKPGCAGWSYRELLPYFKRSEHFEPGPAGDYHGTGGELNVTHPSWRYSVADTFIEAAASVGIPRNDDLNGEQQEGIGVVQVNQKRRQRWSAADAFLGPAVRARANLTIAVHATVTQILLERRVARGVRYVDSRGRTQLARAAHEVILAAGAYNSAPLLECSGIGDPRRVQDLGVDLQHALPGVGENLQDHLQVWVQMGVHGERTLSEDGKFPRVLAAVLRYMVNKTGPLTSPACDVAAFVRAEGSARPMFQIHFTPGAGVMDSAGNMVASVEPGVNAGVTFLRPTARGSVHARSRDLGAFPTIVHNYLATGHDRQLALAGFKLLRAIYRAPSFAARATSELLPGDSTRSDEQILGHWRASATSLYHPVGSARMGPVDDDMAVVDHELRVHGITGLRIVDASIFPSMPSGNTHAPVVAVAERAADLILGRAEASGAALRT